jgi:ComF family protein
MADALVTVALAPCCACCGHPLETPTRGPVCAGCWGAVRALSPPLCRTCGDSLPSWRIVSRAMQVCAACRRGRSAVSCARAAGAYEGTLREIIQAFKYEGRRSLARPLATLMREAGGDLLGDADVVVPVPLHAWRRFRRGFNQAADLAARLDAPVLHALWRVRPTPPQTGLAARLRRRNVRGAFRLSPLVPRARVEGRIVVLVDDVRTTGATLNACAAVLAAAGAREVRALTAARASIRHLP